MRVLGQVDWNGDPSFLQAVTWLASSPVTMSGRESRSRSAAATETIRAGAVPTRLAVHGPVNGVPSLRHTVAWLLASPVTRSGHELPSRSLATSELIGSLRLPAALGAHGPSNGVPSLRHTVTCSSPSPVATSGRPSLSRSATARAYTLPLRRSARLPLHGPTNGVPSLRQANTPPSSSPETMSGRVSVSRSTAARSSTYADTSPTVLQVPNASVLVRVATLSTSVPP